MAYFQKTFTGYNLYAGVPAPGNTGYAGFIIPGAEVKLTGIELDDALTSTSYSGIFVFSVITPTLDASSVQAFITAVSGIAPGTRAMIWLSDPVNITPATCSVIKIAPDGSAVSAGALLYMASGLSLQIQNGMAISVTGTTLTFDGSQSGSALFLSGTQSLLQATNATVGYLHFSGNIGCIQFKTFISLSSLHDYLQWGFQFLYPGKDGNQTNEWLPLATATPAGDSIGFNVTIDLSDVYNRALNPCKTAVCNIADAYNSRRTYLDFLGTNLSGAITVLNSNYTSTFGAATNLAPVIVGAADALPARFVLTPANINATNTTNFLLSPEGDFIIIQPGVINPLNQNILCGLSATEFFTVTPQSNGVNGDVVRYISGQPAYAPQFPLAESGTDTDQGKTPLLTNNFSTSWATVVPVSSVQTTYISQPYGASLYAAKQDVFNNSKDPILGFYPSSFSLSLQNTTITVPFVPYGEVTAGNIDSYFLFEQQIIGPVRKQYLSQDMAAAVPAKVKSAINAINPIQATSPQGLYINVDTSNNQWTLLKLAANDVEEMIDGKLQKKTYLLQFTNLQQLLQSAFQTSHMFLVMSCIDSGTLAAFTGSEMSIEGWPFKFQIPTQNPNGIFSNVLIFKFIGNTSLASLVKTPGQWTMKDDFNYTADSGSLSNLVSWLSGYITSGCQRFTGNGDNDYAKFYDVATNPNWQGIIGLNVNIDLGDFPEQLQGLLAGIDLTRFSAHHFGIDINNVQLKGTSLDMQNNSSLFGLIDYEDTIFQSLDYSVTNYQQQAPIDTSADYVFKVLSLKVLFENSKITNFGSYLALTINKLFGDKILIDNRQNLIILQGNYEEHDNYPVYTFNSIPSSSGQQGSAGDYMLYANSKIINEVEVVNATFNTLVSNQSRSQNSNQTVRSVFALNGYIDFYPLTGFDLFSYGSDTKPVSGRGLAFANMNIDFQFPLATPVATTFSFDVSQMSFDSSQSSSRGKSLVTNFPIQLSGIISSDNSGTPASLGYMNVQLSSLTQKQAVGTQWYGLLYNLNMGTLGALTGALGFNTTFLALWNVGGTGGAAALKLPGVNPQAPFFSLQGVIKINIGNIQLTVADSTDSAYVMKINNIALKLLSLSFPPGGDISFFLFGNPNGSADPQSVGWYTGYLQKS